MNFNLSGGKVKGSSNVRLMVEHGWVIIKLILMAYHGFMLSICP